MTIKEEIAKLSNTLDKTSNRIISEDLMDVTNYKFQETSEDAKTSGALRNVIKDYTQAGDTDAQFAAYSDGKEKIFIGNAGGHLWTQNDLAALKPRFLSIIKDPVLYIDSKNGKRLIVKSAPAQQPVQQPVQPVQQPVQPVQQPVQTSVGTNFNY